MRYSKGYRSLLTVSDQLMNYDMFEELEKDFCTIHKIFQNINVIVKRNLHMNDFPDRKEQTTDLIIIALCRMKKSSIKICHSSLLVPE